MSHLNHIMTLNTKLIEQGIGCPAKQAKITESAIVRAVVSYVYITGGVDGPNLTAEAFDKVENTVGMWNEVSPINCREIISQVQAVFQRLYNQAVAGGKFTPIEPDCEVDIDLLSIPEFESLFRALVTEMIEYNKQA